MTNTNRSAFFNSHQYSTNNARLPLLKHNVASVGLQSMYLLPSHVTRMTSGTSGVHAFHSDFMKALFVTSSKSWASTIDRCGMNVFEQDVLLMLIQYGSNGRKSLFTVLSAKHVRNYSKQRFHHACLYILYIYPNRPVGKKEQHGDNIVVTRISTWLNFFWQHSYGADDIC